MRNSEAEMMIAVTEVRAMIGERSGEPIEVRMKAAMRKVQNNWLIHDEDGQMLVAVAAILMEATPEEKERIEAEMRVLRALNAAIAGVPVDLPVVLSEANIENPVGINGLWKEVKEEASV